MADFWSLFWVKLDSLFFGSKNGKKNAKNPPKKWQTNAKKNAKQIAKKMRKNCQKIAKKFPTNCQKNAKKLPKKCEKIAKKLKKMPKNLRKFAARAPGPVPRNYLYISLKNVFLKKKKKIAQKNNFCGQFQRH